MSERTQRVLAWVGIVIAVAVAIKLASDNHNAIQQINAERDARVEALSRLIHQSCQANNDQDHTLATLLAVSLAQPIPPSTPVTSQLLHARKVFTDELNKLKHPQKCRAAVRSFLFPTAQSGGGGPGGNPGGSTGGGNTGGAPPPPSTGQPLAPGLPCTGVGVNVNGQPVTCRGK